MIYDYKDISKITNLNFKIKKPFLYGKNVLFDIYTESNELLYFQTPSMIIPFTYTINTDTNTFTLTVCEYKSKKYTDIINNIYNNIIQQLKNKYTKLFKDKEYINPFYNKPFYPKMFIFNNTKINDIEIYNILKEKIDLLDIVSTDMITCIFQIKNIWINDTSYGFNLNLLQLRRDNIIKRGYLFIDNQPNYNYSINHNKLNNGEIIERNNKPITNTIVSKKQNSIPCFNMLELLEKRKSILGMTK